MLEPTSQLHLCICISRLAAQSATKLHSSLQKPIRRRVQLALISSRPYPLDRVSRPGVLRCGLHIACRLLFRREVATDLTSVGHSAML